MKLFDLDGPFQRYGTLIFDVLAINALWLVISLFSLGTLHGPASSALYAGTYAGIITNKGYTFKEFFRVLKKRFLPSLAVGLLSVLAYVIILFDLYFFSSTNLPSIVRIIIMALFLFMAIELSFTLSFAYPILAISKTSFKETLRLSFILANKHLGTAFLATIPNILMNVIIVLTFMGFVQLFVFLFFGMALVACLNSFLITKKILTQYDFYIAPESL